MRVFGEGGHARWVHKILDDFRDNDDAPTSVHKARRVRGADSEETQTTQIDQGYQSEIRWKGRPEASQKTPQWRHAK